MKRLLALGLLLMSVCAQAQPRPVIKGRTPLTQLVKLETNLTRKIPLLRVSPLAPIPNAGNALLSPQMVHDQATKLLASASLETFPFKKSQIQPLEQHIHHFVFTIAPRDNPQQIVGTGFVFSQEEEQAPLRLWGATSAQVAQQAGEDVLITFQGLRSTTSFPAKIVFQGHPLGSNAALIEVPQEISQVAMPIPLADKQVIRPHQPLMAYGFDETGRFHKEELMSFVPGPERGLALPARPEEAAPLAGGFVTNRTVKRWGFLQKFFSRPTSRRILGPKGGFMIQRKKNPRS